MKHLKKIAAITGMIILFAMPVYPGLADSVAVVSDHGGSAKAFTSGKWKDAEINMPLYEGDTLLTRGGSFMEVTFDDATIVRLDSNSQMKLAELKRQGSVAKTIFNLAKGRFFAIVDKLKNPKSKFEVHTRMAIAAVKGTELIVQADNDSALLGVTKGSVQFIGKGSVKDDGEHGDGSANDRPGVMVGAGHYSKCLKGKGPLGIRKWSAETRINRTIGKMREEIKFVRRLKQKGGDAVYKWRIEKKLKKNGKIQGGSHTEGTIGGTNKYVGKLKKNIHKRLKNKLKGELNAARSHAVHDLKHINEHMKADIHLGKTMTDVHGNRVRIEEFMFRPNPRQVDLLSVTLRDGRLDYLRGENIFKYNLPKDPTWKQWKLLWQKEWTAFELDNADFFNPEATELGPRNHLIEQRVKLSNVKDWVYMGTLYKPNLWNDTAGTAHPNKWRLLKDIDMLALGTGEPTAEIGNDVVNIFTAEGKSTTWGLMIHRPDLVKEQRMYDRTPDGEIAPQQAHRGPLDKTFTDSAQAVGAQGWIDEKKDSYIGTNMYNTLMEWENILLATSDNVASGQQAGDNTPGKYNEENSMPDGDQNLAFRHIRYYNDGSTLDMTLSLIDDYGKLKTAPDKDTNLLGLLSWTADLVFNTNIEISAKSNVFEDQKMGIDVVSRMLWWIMLNPKNADYDSPDNSNILELNSNSGVELTDPYITGQM